MELVSVTNPQNQQVQRLPPLAGQMGGRYTLANNAISHSVPPIGVLQANIDQQAGVIDTWPAHPSNQRPSNMQLSLNKFNNLVLSNSSAEGKPDVTPKPKFLENLEKFVQRELKALGCSNNGGTNEVRLQAYREAFEYLLEEFKTYKPILSVIKNEYEMMLALQREKIRELEPLKQMLVTLADQCDYKLMQYREEEKTEIKLLKEDKKRQMEQILELKNGNHMLQIQVEKLQSEVSKEHERFRNEQDKRKLLILDLNDLRFQQEEAKLAEMKREKKRMAQGMPDEEDTQDDPVTLKIALRCARKNLNDAMTRLTKMEADYGDVVSRHDYEHLKTANENLKATHEQMNTEYSANKKELTTLKDSYGNLEIKCKDIERQLEEYGRECTPRPDWDLTANVIETEKWNNLSTNKTSIQNLELMVHELGGKKDGFKFTEYHAALGTEPEVPTHLRTEGSRGQVKKISVAKRDICLIIKDFWKQREGQTSEFGDFYIRYLRKRYNTDMNAFEYSYALNEALEKITDNEYVQQFSKILNGKLDEDIYHNEQKVIKKFLDTLKETEKGEKSSDDTISKAGFQESVRSIFKYLSKKTTDFTESLVKVVEEELNMDASNARIEYKQLFVEDFKEKHGLFINALRACFKEERLTFANKLRETIGSRSEIAFNDLKQATKEEQVLDKDLEKIINWCFEEEKQIEIDQFNKRIETCGYYPL